MRATTALVVLLPVAGAQIAASGPCAQELRNIQLAPSLSAGLIEIPECNPGGGYSPVQCSGTTLFCWCVTNANAPIEGTVVHANRQIAATCAALRASENQRDGDKPVTATLVRLVNTLNPSDRTAGILEASVDGGIRWGPICNNHFDQNDFAVEVVCRMMGFDTHEILSMGYFSQCDVSAPRGDDFVLDDVQCPDRTAASLDTGCTFRKATDCDTPSGVWISCMSSTCTLHEYQNGAGLNVDPDSVWGAMCSSLDHRSCVVMHECTWTAAVGRRMPACMGVLIDPHATTHATVSHLGLVDSDGNEVPVGQGVHAAVGVLTAVADGITGFVCDDYFDSSMAAAIAACTDLGFDRGIHCDSVTLTPLMKAGAGVPNVHTLDFSLDNVRCGGGATSLNDCMSTTDEVSTNMLRCNQALAPNFQPNCVQNCGDMEAVLLSCTTGTPALCPGLDAPALRLENPPFATLFRPEDRIPSNGHLRQGVLEASIDGVSWGPVCNDFFDINAATIACRQLGFDQVPVAHCDGAALSILRVLDLKSARATK